MGRKIPAKKHHGVKDPLKQQAKRLQSIKNKINAPPRDPDEQPIPRSLTQLFQLPEKRKQKAQRRPRQNAIGKKGDNKGLSGVRGLKRAPGESARDFSRRITGAVRALHETLPDHYPGDEDDDDEVTEDRGARRRMRRQKDQNTHRTTKNGTEKDGSKLTRAQRRRQKMQAKKQEKQAAAKSEISEVQYERVPFGVSVDAPPTLTAPRRAKAHDSAPRPGRRDLLLTSILQPSSAAPSTPSRLVMDAKERQRLAVVAAYRKIKANRRSEQASKAL